MEALGKRFDWLSAHLGEKKHLMGDQFTVADAYLFTVLGWTRHVGIDLGKWPVLAAYRSRVGQHGPRCTKRSRPRVWSSSGAHRAPPPVLRRLGRRRSPGAAAHTR